MFGCFVDVERRCFLAYNTLGTRGTFLPFLPSFSILETGSLGLFCDGAYVKNPVPAECFCLTNNYNPR